MRKRKPLMTCTKCSKTFVTRGNFERHKSKCIKRYKCSKCGKGFRNLLTYESHYGNKCGEKFRNQEEIEESQLLTESSSSEDDTTMQIDSEIQEDSIIAVHEEPLTIIQNEDPIIVFHEEPLTIIQSEEPSTIIQNEDAIVSEQNPLHNSKCSSKVLVISNGYRIDSAYEKGSPISS